MQVHDGLARGGPVVDTDVEAVRMALCLDRGASPGEEIDQVRPLVVL